MRLPVELLGVLAAGALAGCGGGSSSASNTSDSELATSTGHGSVLRLQSQITSPLPSVNSANGPGSELVLTGMLFQPRGPSAIGRFQGSCVRTALGNGPVFECQLTYILKDGALFAAAVASAQGPANGAVTGGTGRYAGARGTLSYKATGTPRVDLTLDLTSLSSPTATTAKPTSPAATTVTHLTSHALPGLRRNSPRSAHQSSLSP
jgi:hypothetical protein